MKRIHIEDIEHSVNLYTKKKSSNILEGGFRSLYHGKSMDFDDLRDYTYGDDVGDIDWKASSRANTTLVRKNTAEKRHFLLIICDSGIKMTAETPKRNIKCELSAYTLGTIARSARNSDIDIGLLFAKGNSIELTPFQSSEAHIENILSTYQDNVNEQTDISITTLLKHALENIQKRMMVVVISDLISLEEVNEKILLECEEKNDLFFVCINDAKLTEGNTYDLDSNNYFHDKYLSNTFLKEIESAAINNKKNSLVERIHSSNSSIIYIEDEESLCSQLDYLFTHNEV